MGGPQYTVFYFLIHDELRDLITRVKKLFAKIKRMYESRRKKRENKLKNFRLLSNKFMCPVV